METIEELCQYLEEECYSFSQITIGNHFTPEGLIIEKNGDSYEFSYSERGNKRVIESFQSEKELVEYALGQLKADEWNRAHFVAWVWNEEEILQAERELKEEGISFRRNDIPCFDGKRTAYRICVYGRDVLKTEELKNKYWKRFSS